MKLSRLLPEDYPILKPYFSRPKYRLCSYSLSSAIAWSNQEYQPYKMVTDDAVVIGCEFTKNKENRHLMLPISPAKEFTPEALQELASDLGFTNFWFVPEEYIRTYGEERVASIFQITEQKGYSDYIYLTRDLMNLKGNKYSKKRNLIHQFERNCLGNNEITVEPMTTASMDECLDFMDRWCEERDCSVDDDSNLACEKEAANNTMAHMELLEVKGLMLRIDGQISAFGMTSVLTQEMGVMHFEKALVGIKGLYQYFDNICVKHLLKDYKYTNKENDMDLPGLIKSKKSYHPVMMVRSYELKLH